MASIRTRKRSDGTIAHVVCFRIGHRQTSEVFDTARDARDFTRLIDQVGAETAVAIRDARTNAPAGMPTLDAWLDHHLEHATGITAGTVAEYRRLAARTWAPTLGPLPVDAITRDAVAQWVGRQAKASTARGKPTASKTIRNAHGLLSTVLAGAVDAGLRPDNPCRGLRLPGGIRGEMVLLSESELARLVAAVPPVWQPLVLTLAGTGMRFGEATALRWADVDLDGVHPYVRVSQAWKAGPTVRVLGAPKTRRGLRTIHLAEQLVAILRESRGAPEDLVFTGPRGKGRVHHQVFYRVWAKAVTTAALGKRPRIHDLRHYYASQMIAHGASVMQVQRRLGHESAKTTLDVYGHLAPDEAGQSALMATLILGAAAPLVEGQPAIGT